MLSKTSYWRIKVTTIKKTNNNQIWDIDHYLKTQHQIHPIKALTIVRCYNNKNIHTWNIFNNHNWSLYLNPIKILILADQGPGQSYIKQHLRPRPRNTMKHNPTTIQNWDLRCLDVWPLYMHLRTFRYYIPSPDHFIEFNIIYKQSDYTLSISLPNWKSGKS